LILFQQKERQRDLRNKKKSEEENKREIEKGDVVTMLQKGERE
jgi:hypothetical protein